MKKVTSFDEGRLSGAKGTGTDNVPVFGIDLGTTNSAISVITEGDAPETIQLHDGWTMPSCVMWENDEITVGKSAYVNREQANTVYSVKRLMQDPHATVTIDDNGKVFTKRPAEVSAEILKGLVEQTQGQYGTIKDVVVTVPAYFDINGINATREACELAGLNLIGIANEPTAASLCYELKATDGEEKDVVVYDLGGGTFDVTLMRIRDAQNDDEFDFYSDENEESNSCRSVVTLDIDGDTRLGGDDLDEELVKIVIERFKSEQEIDLSDITRESYENLKLRLEGFKKKGVELIYQLKVDYPTKSGDRVKGDIFINREDFYKATKIIFDRTAAIVDRMLKRNETNANTIILTGGSTKNPLLVDMIREYYTTFTVDDALSPDLAVSNGAAIQGKITKFGDTNVQVFDILPLTIGVLESDDKICPVIDRGTSLPVIKTVHFTTDKDDQTVIGVELFQGNSIFKEECISLGKLTIDGINAAPQGEADINVTINITADRLMKCSVTVDEKSRELQLDLSGDVKVNKLSDTDKTIKRLERSAKYLDDKNREVFEAMLVDFKEGKSVTVADIKEFVREHRSTEIS